MFSLLQCLVRSLLVPVSISHAKKCEHDRNRALCARETNSVRKGMRGGATVLRKPRKPRETKVVHACTPSYFTIAKQAAQEVSTAKQLDPTFRKVLQAVHRLRSHVYDQCVIRIELQSRIFDIRRKKCQMNGHEIHIL